MSGLPIKIKDPKGYNRKVGSLHLSHKGRVFYKNVKRKVHRMNVVGGYGIQKEVFDKHLRGRKGRIFIHEEDTGKWLVASIKTWTKHSHTGNYGAGKQIFLGDKFMHNSENFDRSILA